MYILSQNKKTLGKYDAITISKNFGGKKEEKYFIVGIKNVMNETIGKYPTREQADYEIERIYNAIKNGEKVYAVK